jgi:transglutaminase-like putative cysteine protease
MTPEGLVRAGGRWLRALRHPVAVGVSAVAVLAVVLAFDDTLGIVAALFGALLGYVAGEWLGRSSLRLPIALGLIGGSAGLAGMLARQLAWSTGLAGIVGSSPVIRLSMMVAWSAAAFAYIALPRVLVRRRPAWAAVELLSLSGAFALAFAPHRDGAIARPLWLADRVWRWGVDPSIAFLGVGGLFVVLLLWLRLGETRRRLTLLSVVFVPLVAIVLGLLVDPGEWARPAPPVVRPSDGGSDGEGAAGEGEGSTGEQPDAESGSSGSKPRPVAVVLLDDDYDPPSGGYYLRQESFSAFNGSRLVEATLPGADSDTLDHFPTGPTALQPVPTAGRQRLRGRVAVLVDHRRPFSLETAASYDVWPNPNPVRFRRAWRFEAQSVVGAYGEFIGQTAGSSAWTPELWSLYTAVPPDPRYQELAESLRAGLAPEFSTDPFALALAVKVYLDENTKYSKAERHAGTEDPTADFLFGNRIGYCVHTAHAAAYLWRALGLPARVSAGYHVDAADRRGAALLVMDRDAHEWPEVYLESFGWVILDISPKENLDPPGDPLDEDLSALLADMANQPPDAEQPPFDRAAWRRWLGRVGVYAVISALSLAIAALTVAKMWRRFRPMWATPGEQSRVSYRTALDLLADVGVARESGESRERFARRVAVDFPAMQRLTDWHLAARLGRPGPVHVQPEQWHAAIAELRGEVVARRGRVRRWLGILHLVSIWRAR